MKKIKHIAQDGSELVDYDYQGEKREEIVRKLREKLTKSQHYRGLLMNEGWQDLEKELESNIQALFVKWLDSDEKVTEEDRLQARVLKKVLKRVRDIADSEAATIKQLKEYE